jgi:hypothetical protein
MWSSDNQASVSPPSEGFFHGWSTLRLGGFVPDCGPCQIGKAAKQEKTMSANSYRPESYFWANKLGIGLISDIKGAERRKLITQLVETNDTGYLPPELSAHALPQSQREAHSRIHPDMMGGEYLPDRKRGEVEIARITIASTTQDVIAVYARQIGRRIHYRVVDEYGGDTQSANRKRTSVKPLTLEQLVNFFLGAWNLIICLDCNFGQDPELREEIHNFIVDASSDFYADFEFVIRERVDAWLDASGELQ